MTTIRMVDPTTVQGKVREIFEAVLRRERTVFRANAVSNIWRCMGALAGAARGELEPVAHPEAARRFHPAPARAHRDRGVHRQRVPLLNRLARGRRDAAGCGRDGSDRADGRHRARAGAGHTAAALLLDSLEGEGGLIAPLAPGEGAPAAEAVLEEIATWA
jgi:hypothetical protein